MFDRLLVVCVGNICRSPMAEGLLRAHFPDRMVASAGTGALVGEPADRTALLLMRERGLDLSAHRARQLDIALLRGHDLVLVMDVAQREWIEGRWPEGRGRVYRWGHWSDFDVPDPYRQDVAAFKEVLTLLDRGLEDWKGKL